MTPEQIQALLTCDEHHSAATRRRLYSTLCTFYHWLLRHEVVNTNPIDRLDPIEQESREPRPLSPEAVTKILQAIPTVNLRDRTLFTLLYETGIRVGEALSLLTTDVDLSTDDEKIRVFRKGQRERTVMLTAISKVRCSMRKSIRTRSSMICSATNSGKGGSGNHGEGTPGTHLGGQQRGGPSPVYLDAG